MLYFIVVGAEMCTVLCFSSLNSHYVSDAAATAVSATFDVLSGPGLLSSPKSKHLGSKEQVFYSLNILPTVSKQCMDEDFMIMLFILRNIETSFM